MNDPIKAILAGGGLKTTAFDAGSRYYGIEITTLGAHESGSGANGGAGTSGGAETGGGVGNFNTQKMETAYLRRRFLPSTDGFTLLKVHRVGEGERLDHIAAKHLGDAEQFWRICDANEVMHPEELTEVIGAEVRITLPEGINGGSGANG